MPKSDWNATAFFENLCAVNRLAVAEGFTFCRCSGLDGFEEAIAALQSATAICAVSDIADGYTALNNTPRTRRVKTIFLAMRHAAEDMEARNACMETMRELFRQFMSRLILEKVRIEQDCIYIDPRITFNEIERYFFSGAACAYFQIGVDVFTDLRHNDDEWTDNYNTNQYGYDLWITECLTNTFTNTVSRCLRTCLGISLQESVAIDKGIRNGTPQIIANNLTEPVVPESLAPLQEYYTLKFVPNGQSPI